MLLRRFWSRWVALVISVVVVALLSQPHGPLASMSAPTRVAVVAALFVLGWLTVRDMGRLARPMVLSHLPHHATGPADYLLRGMVVVVVVGGALHVAGVSFAALAATGTVGVAVLGLAAQQSLSNLVAGTVLLGVHPYHVGDRLRLQGSTLGGQVEGRVATMGLFYTRLRVGEDHIHVPNAALLNATLTPLREPEGVDVRVHLAPGIRPTDVQTALRRLTTPTRALPHVDLEELADDRAVVRITVVPRRAVDGPRLADEVISAVGPITRDGDPED